MVPLPCAIVAHNLLDCCPRPLPISVDSLVFFDPPCCLQALEEEIRLENHRREASRPCVSATVPLGTERAHGREQLVEAERV